MVLKKSELTLPSKMQNTPFRQGKTFLTRGIVIIGCIRNVIWSSAFSIKSKLFAELLLVMISLLHRFLLSYTSLPFGFCLNNTTFLSFQIRSNISHTDSNDTHSVSQNPHVQENKSKINSNRQTDGLEHEKMKFSDILTALGINWIDRISHEPHSEKSFEHYDEKDRNTKNCTLPYNLKSDKAAMTEAIKYLFAYSYYATGLAESNKKLLDAVIREISEMTEKEKQTLDKEVVGYNDIIDKINEINHNYSLIDWFNSFEQKWTEIISQRGNEIKNKRAYLKSCIWNWLKDFQFDEESNFRASESISDSSTENKYEIFMNAF